MSASVTKEKQLALQVAQYLQYQYPNALYRFDLAADLKLTIGQAARHKRMHPDRGFPDLFIYVPRFGWHGLAIELKVEGAHIYKQRDGTPATEHVREQSLMLDKLNGLGYKAVFARGFQEAKEIIDSYLTQFPESPDYQSTARL